MSHLIGNSILERTNIRAAFVSVVMLTMMSGCGYSAPNAAAHGEVSYQGKPVAVGTIRFFPRDGNAQGGSVGADITDGKYKVPLGRGLRAGEYLVSVNALKSTGKLTRRDEVAAGESPMMPEVVQYIPAKFSDELTLEVSLAPGESQQDFVLQ